MNNSADTLCNFKCYYEVLMQFKLPWFIPFDIHNIIKVSLTENSTAGVTSPNLNPARKHYATWTNNQENSSVEVQPKTKVKSGCIYRFLCNYEGVKSKSCPAPLDNDLLLFFTALVQSWPLLNKTRFYCVIQLCISSKLH